jgi:ankyrin repeat protein
MIDIQQAIIDGDLDYIKNKVNANNVNTLFYPDQKSFLTLACIKGQLEIARYLVEVGADINASSGSNKVTPLIASVICDQQPMVEWLMAHGELDYDRQDKSRMTALMHSVKKDKTKLADLLIDKTDLSLTNTFGDSVHYLVCSEEMSDLFREHITINSPPR